MTVYLPEWLTSSQPGRSLGEKGREKDYQIWTCPSMGAFNNWVKAPCLEDPQNRHVVDLEMHILRGCAFLYRVQSLVMQGVVFPTVLQQYIPMQVTR